ncbi:MAG: ATP-binding cassette subfamily B multidrug efflux pump [Planctomycetota bacterium]|jgi:ATP-binding cassette subfamily B multidrug efflux pump
MSSAAESVKAGGTAGQKDSVEGRDVRVAARLWIYMRPHRFLIGTGLSLLLITSACRLIAPFIVKIAIDDYITPRNLDGFPLLMLCFIGVSVAELFLRRLHMYTVDKAGQNALLDLRLALFGHMQKLSMRFHDRNKTGVLVGRVTTDIEALQELFSSGVVTILGDAVFIVATLGILFWQDWQLTLISLVIVPFLLLTTTLVRSRVRGAYEAMRSRISQMNGFLHENVSGMSLVQIFLREDLARSEFDPINAGVRDSQIRAMTLESVLSAAVELLGSLTTALILWYGGGLVIEGMGLQANEGLASGLTLGALFLFVDYMQKFFRPLSDLSQKYTVLQNALTAGGRIFKLMDEEDVVPEPTTEIALPSPHGDIEFRDVTFGYGEGEPALKNISWRLEPGQSLAIVGDTGAGKTTILKLLTRLYHLEHGGILVDGLDIRDYPSKELRRRVGVVPQDVFLFEGTILENIALGHPEITPEDARQIAEQLHLGELFNRFPLGYDEVVTERGKNLSSGEKQLISFARVLATKPEILVLDEATSNVDSHTEHLLQEAVAQLMKGRTSVIIAHRLSTVRDADRILVLRKGKLVEQGTHDELFESNGIYRKLHDLQQITAAPA